MNKIKEFLKLVEENPELQIIPMVDSDVCCDDTYHRWMGSFGCAYVGEYACYNERYYDDKEDFKDDYYNNNEDNIYSKFLYISDREDRTNEIEKYLEKIANKYFKRAIIVNIDLPDEDDILNNNNEFNDYNIALNG